MLREGDEHIVERILTWGDWDLELRDLELRKRAPDVYWYLLLGLDVVHCRLSYIICISEIIFVVFLIDLIFLNVQQETPRNLAVTSWKPSITDIFDQFCILLSVFRIISDASNVEIWINLAENFFQTKILPRKVRAIKLKFLLTGVLCKLDCLVIFKFLDNVNKLAVVGALFSVIVDNNLRQLSQLIIRLHS